MPNSPTIVSAALSDKELQASINQMVANFDKGLQTMLEHSNEYVGKIQESLQKIGNTNFGAKGSNDGGVVKQTKQHKELTEAVSKETQKLQDLQQSLSGASDREQNFISQKERAANTIAQENELLQRQEQELANLKNQQSSFSGANQQTTASIEKQREAVANLKNEVKYWQSIVSQLQSGDKKTRFNNLWIGDTTSKQGHDILDVANKLYSIMQKLGMETEKGSASTGQAVKVVEQLAKYYKISREEAEKLVMSVQESPLARGKFTTHYDTRFGLDNLTMQKKDAEDSALRLLIAQSKLERQTDDLALANKRLADSESSSTQASQQKVQIESQIAAKEKEIAETKGRIATATREQSEAEKNASQAAKEKANIQSQVANQEKQVAEAKKQLTTATQQHTEAETKSSRATKEKSMTLDQQASAINTAVQSEKKYTDEVLRQAAAIRSSKEWQEKGHVVIGDVNYYDKERANVSKRDKQLLLSLEEQIVQAQQNEAEAARRAAQETRNQAQAQQQVQQSALGTARIIESVHEMQRRSANFQKGNASVPTFTVELESAKRLSDRLKELREQYNNMNFGQRIGKEGQAVAQQIREITRQGQILNNQLNRPTKKEVFGLSEKTLDDIAYKMRQLASYRSGLDANAQHNEIRRVNYEYDVLKKKMDEVMQKNSQMISSNTALGRSWNYMKNRLAFYFTVGASTQFIKNLIEVRSQYEMNERALGILVDSAERGTQIFNELSQMALVSPYTLIELSSAAKQLTAYDVAAKDVVDTTRRLADMASAVGVPVERLTYALGQIKAYGYLNSRDARMFANAGIPLVKELADHYTRLEGRLVSTADIYDRIKKKAIDYNDVMQVMNEMTDEGGKFYDFQAKMADTLKVQLANLTLAWNNMLNDLGNSQQGLLTSGIGALKELFLHWKDLDRILTNLAVTIGTAKAAQLLLNMSFGKGTLAAIKNISAIEGNTAAMYENALSKSNLSKAEARWLVSTNRSNVALRAAMVNMKLLTAEEAKAAASTTVLGVRMGWLGRVMKTNFFGLASVVRGAAVGMEMLGKAMLSIVTNPVFLSITAAMALVDALLYYNQIAEKTAEMNKAIADNAKEASEAIGDYLKDSVNIGNRAKAAQGVLSVSEGQKAWESIREQIELSSDAASVFISKLLEEEDINKRVKEGFDVAESIREATNAMAGLNAEALKVSQDSWLWGAFGEGLAEDLEDYIEAVQRGRKNGANIGSRYFAAGERDEAIKELTAFANDAEEIIRDRLGAGVNDAVQLKEAIERIKKEVITANPQIKGEVKKWFDVEVDRMMAERFGGVYNELSSIQSQFIEHIKRDSGAALRRLSDDILDTSKELDDEVLSAISKAWDKLKDELPAESQDLISKLQKQMDENPLTLRVLLLQAGEQQIRDAIQKDYEQHFYDSNIGEKPTRPKDVGSLWGDYEGDYKAFAAAQKKHEKEMVEYNQKNAEWEAKRAEYVAKYGDFNKKNDETRAKWAKRVNDEIKATDAEEKAAKHARESLEAELSLEERKTDARYLSAVQEEQAAKDRKSAAQEAWNYEKLYQEEKNKSSRGSRKDILGDALAKEVQLIGEIQKRYKEYQQIGVNAQEAIRLATDEYGNTLKRTNTILGKYGISTKDSSELAAMDIRDVRDYYKSLLEMAKSTGNAKGIEAIEKALANINVEITKLDYKKITDGLNNELGKLKDEYELAVELDANPEMGNMFTEMFRIDTSAFPKTINEFMQMAQQEFEDVRKKLKLSESINIFTANSERWYKWGEAVGYSKEQVDDFKKSFDGSIGVAKKWAQDVVKQTQDLQYKLADNNGKIAIEEEKLANLRVRLANEVNDEQKRLLELQIQDQQNAIDKLKEGILEMLPTYQRAFGQVAEHSAWMTRRLMQDYKTMLVNAQKAGKNENGKYVITDPISGEKTEVTENKLGKEIKNADKELQKTQSTVKKITEAFKKGEDGVVDWVHGVELIGEELGKMGQLVDVVGNIADAFSNPNEYNETAEAIHDVAASLQGVSTAAKGIGQIASGDYIGGAVSVASGLFSAISTWFDNSDKKILQQIKESERAVKRLENAYKELEYAAGNAFGAATSGAQEAIKANKELQLVELKRQLALEQSRDSKHRDEDRIIEIRGQIIDLEHEIRDFTKNAVNDLLGISSHGDFFESMISEMIDAFKNGEDAMEVFEEKWSDMIDNMIMKTIVSQVLSQWVKTLEHGADEILEKYTEESSKKMTDLTNEMTNLRTMDVFDAANWIYDNDRETYNKILESLTGRKVEDIGRMERLAWSRKIVEAYLAMLDNSMAGLQDELDKASLDATGELIDYYGEAGKEFKENYLGQILDKIQENWNFGQDSEKQLSNLQQGISQISETTANALEAYMNSVNQQVYYHSSLLEQIRDSVVGLDLDVSLGVQSQMLLQLQNSYQTQQAIQQILEGVLVPSGRAFAVELTS